MRVGQKDGRTARRRIYTHVSRQRLQAHEVLRYMSAAPTCLMSSMITVILHRQIVVAVAPDTFACIANTINKILTLSRRDLVKIWVVQIFEVAYSCKFAQRTQEQTDCYLEGVSVSSCKSSKAAAEGRLWVFLQLMGCAFGQKHPNSTLGPPTRHPHPP